VLFPGHFHPQKSHRHRPVIESSWSSCNRPRAEAGVPPPKLLSGIPSCRVDDGAKIWTNLLDAVLDTWAAFPVAVVVAAASIQEPHVPHRHSLAVPSRNGAGDRRVLHLGRVFLFSRRDSYSTAPETCRGEDTEERVVGGVLVGDPSVVVELVRIAVVPSVPHAARIQPGVVGVRWRRDSAVVACVERYRREIFGRRWGILLSFVCWSFAPPGKEKVLLSLPLWGIINCC
jgi:hypothetical protein